MTIKPQDLIKLLEDALEGLAVWDVHHGDELGNEIYEIQKQINEIKEITGGVE